MEGPLTKNAIDLLNSAYLQEASLRVVLQVMEVKEIGNRFHLELSDGSFFQHAEVAPQVNEYVRNRPVVRGSIVRLEEYVCTKKIHILRMKVLRFNSEIIGAPKEYGEFGDLAGGRVQEQPRSTPRQPVRRSHFVPQCFLIAAFLLLFSMHYSRGSSNLQGDPRTLSPGAQTHIRRAEGKNLRDVERDVKTEPGRSGMGNISSTAIKDH